MPIVATHAHLDHTGRLPLLPSRGFRGPIHATPATVDFTRLILADSARLQQADADRQSRRLLRAGRSRSTPLYGPADVEALAPLFSALPYDERREIADGIEVRLVDAGHILGSASVEMTVREHGRERVVVFSGDVGLKGSPILRDPTPLDHADLVFLESTYGDRDHRSQEETLQEFHEILARAVRERREGAHPGVRHRPLAGDPLSPRRAGPRRAAPRVPRLPRQPDGDRRDQALCEAPGAVRRGGRGDDAPRALPPRAHAA